MCEMCDTIDNIRGTFEPGKCVIAEGLPVYREISTDFKSELRAIINRCSMENGSNTPDFLLASYLVKCLENFNMAVTARDNWYGVHLNPGCSVINENPKATDPTLPTPLPCPTCGKFGLNPSCRSRPFHDDPVKDPIEQVRDRKY